MRWLRENSLLINHQIEFNNRLSSAKQTLTFNIWKFVNQFALFLNICFALYLIDVFRRHFLIFFLLFWKNLNSIELNMQRVKLLIIFLIWQNLIRKRKIKKRKLMISWKRKENLSDWEMWTNTYTTSWSLSFRRKSSWDNRRNDAKTKLWQNNKVNRKRNENVEKFYIFYKVKIFFVKVENIIFVETFIELIW